MLSQRRRAWYLTLEEQALHGYWLRAGLLGWWSGWRQSRQISELPRAFSLERGEPEPGLRLATGLWVLWCFRGHRRKGRTGSSALLAVPGAVECQAARADAPTVAGEMAFEYGDVAAARVLLLEAVD